MIFNIDQTPSKYVPTSKVTMARRGSKQVSLAGSNDKRTITATYAQTLAGDILPFQLIYKGKTKRSLPKTTFPKGFVLSANKSHWSNETETIRLLNRIIHPYAQRKKADLDLPSSQKSLIIWDAFRGHETDKVEDRLEVLDIETKGVPGNFTHLLQPLDLTTNSASKKIDTWTLGLRKTSITQKTYYFAKIIATLEPGTPQGQPK